MSFKSILKRVLKAPAWPFIHIYRGFLSAKAQKAAKILWREIAKTPEGQIILEEVDRTLSDPSSLKDFLALAWTFRHIIARLEAAKINYKDSLIHLGIQLAIQFLKGNFN